MPSFDDIEQDVFNTIDNQDTPIARAMRGHPVVANGTGEFRPISAHRPDMYMQGVPTAEQEALQQPAIDPTMVAGIGAGFGLMPMLHALAMGTLSNVLPGGGPVRNAAMMLPGPNILRLMDEVPAVGKMGDAMYGLTKQHIGSILKDSGIFGGMSDSEIGQTAGEVLWDDSTSLGNVLQAGNPETSVTEQWGNILRGLKNKPTDYYRGGEIGRPLGLSAAITDARNRLLGGNNAGRESMASRNDSEGGR